MLNKFWEWLEENDLNDALKDWFFALILLLVLAAGVYQICQDICWLFFE
jgi:hypothetical protein